MYFLPEYYICGVHNKCSWGQQASFAAIATLFKAGCMLYTKIDDKQVYIREWWRRFSSLASFLIIFTSNATCRQVIVSWVHISPLQSPPYVFNIAMTCPPFFSLIKAWPHPNLLPVVQILAACLENMYMIKCTLCMYFDSKPLGCSTRFLSRTHSPSSVLFVCSALLPQPPPSFSPK